MSKVCKSYQGYTENTYASRKGRLCLIKKIHFEMLPPSVTVLMMDNDCEVGTEFDRLQPIEAWLCSLCTARNEDVNAGQCCFCRGARTYKEQIIVKTQQQSQSQPAAENVEVSEPSDKETSPESTESAGVDATQNETQPTEHCESESDNEFVQVEHEPEVEGEDDDGTDDEDAQDGSYGRGDFYSPFYQHQPMYRRTRPKPRSSYGRRSRHSLFDSPFGAFGGFW